MRRSASGPLPGFDNEIVGTQLATVPRVKPEASEIARRSKGQMGSILAQGQPRPRVYVSSSLEDSRPKTAPVRKGPIVNDPLIEIIQEMLIFSDIRSVMILYHYPEWFISVCFSGSITSN